MTCMIKYVYCINTYCVVMPEIVHTQTHIDLNILSQDCLSAQLASDENISFCFAAVCLESVCPRLDTWARCRAQGVCFTCWRRADTGRSKRVVTGVTLCRTVFPCLVFCRWAVLTLIFCWDSHWPARASLPRAKISIMLFALVESGQLLIFTQPIKKSPGLDWLKENARHVFKKGQQFQPS